MQFSPDAHRAAAEAFAACKGSDTSNSLDRHSFKKAVLAATGIKVSSEGLEQLLGSAATGDAQLGFEALLHVVRKLQAHKDPDSQMRDVYRAFDSSGAGFLRRQDVLAVFAQAAPTVRTSTVEEVFDELDAGHSGRVSCEAFLGMLRSRGPEAWPRG